MTFLVPATLTSLLMGENHVGRGRTQQAPSLPMRPQLQSDQPRTSTPTLSVPHTCPTVHTYLPLRFALTWRGPRSPPFPAIRPQPHRKEGDGPQHPLPNPHLPQPRTLP